MFAKSSILDVWLGSEYASGNSHEIFEDMVLEIIL